MEREKAKQVLIRQGWLSTLPELTRQKVLEKTVLKRFKKGETIYEVNDLPGGMYGLVSGSLGITIAPSFSGPYLAHYGRPGFWFGEGPILSGENRRVGVIARSETTVLFLPLAAIRELIEADPAFWRYLGLNALLSLDLALRAYDDMKIKDSRTRVCSILLRLAGFQTPSFVANEPCRVEISQTELAGVAGLSRNVVSRVLSGLSKEKLVTLGYGSIDLPDPSRLVDRISRRSSD